MAVLNEERIQWIDGMKTPSYTSLLSSNGGKWWRGGWQHTHWTITPTSCMGFSTTQRRIFVIGRVPSEGKQKFFLNFHSHLLLLMLYFIHFRWLLSPILSSPRLHRGRLLLRLCPMGNLLSIVIVPFLRLHRGRLLPCMCSLGNLLRFVPPPRVNLFCLLRLLFSHPYVLLRRRSFSFFSHPCVLLLRRSLRDLTTMAKMDTAVVIERWPRLFLVPLSVRNKIIVQRSGKVMLRRWGKKRRKKLEVQMSWRKGQ